MALKLSGRVRAWRIAGFGLTTPDAARLAEFYVGAFGCRCGPRERLEGAAFERLMGVPGGAERRRLTVGREVIELLQFDHCGAPYPAHSSSIERTFQHFALVAADMHRAVLGLEGIKGWRPISASGPQRLPAASGGVTAYKLRDPDGHPLEILEFPAAHTPARWTARPRAQGILGIDHSAISIADTAVSVAFYRALGLTPTLHTLNQGPEQAALDDISDPLVEVTALRSAVPDPHLELLCYRSDAPRGTGATAANDVAATRITVAVDPAGSADDPSASVGGSIPQVLVRDPDGHRLHLIPAPTCGNMRASP